jgi:hypothetical protein
VLLFAVLFALLWYFVSFHLLWKSVMPLVALLHAERATLLGHLVYGTFLGRYPEYLPKAKPQKPEQVTEAPASAPLVESPSQPPDN